MQGAQDTTRAEAWSPAGDPKPVREPDSAEDPVDRPVCECEPMKDVESPQGGPEGLSGPPKKSGLVRETVQRPQKEPTTPAHGPGEGPSRARGRAPPERPLRVCRRRRGTAPLRGAVRSSCSRKSAPSESTKSLLGVSVQAGGTGSPRKSVGRPCKRPQPAAPGRPATEPRKRTRQSLATSATGVMGTEPWRRRRSWRGERGTRQGASPAARKVCRQGAGNALCAADQARGAASAS